MGLRKGQTKADIHIAIYERPLTPRSLELTRFLDAEGVDAISPSGV